MAEQNRTSDAPNASGGLDGLMSWLDSSPTPFHVVNTATSVLAAAGFGACDGLGGDIPANGYLASDGALLAWRIGDPQAGFRIVGAHTDSPNLRIQPSPDLQGHGWSQLGVEIYGGVLLNSWLDRDLGIAGRALDRTGASSLFCCAEPLARVPQLAIHLDRSVNESGLLLDKQTHMMPVWGTRSFVFGDWLGEVTGLDDIVAFDAHLYDLTPARVIGADSSLLASARLDNQVSCWAAVCALAAAPRAEACEVVVLNDHEEVGSDSRTGAAGPLLERLISTIIHRHGFDPGAAHDILSRSWCVSADNAHAVHPNYPERHEPRHSPRPNCGPALKINGNQRYATSAHGLAHLRRLADAADIPHQTFVSRNNMPCGSTIGPITATRLGIETIDIGVPQLSMHSARELCGAHDPEHLRDLLLQFLRN